MDGSVFRVERASGRVLWQKSVGAASAPAVADGRVMVSRKIGGAADAGAREQAIVLSAEDGQSGAQGGALPGPGVGGESRDRLLAKKQAGAWGVVPHGEQLGLENVAAGWAFQGSSASIADGRAYFAVGGEIRAREVATGREVWRRAYAQASGAQAVS